MKKVLFFAFLLLALSASADNPFRTHRFSAFRALPADSNAILFVGNSITDMHPWPEAFAGVPLPLHVCNRGVSGATSDEILEHIDELVAGRPRQLFLMIGTNDLGMGLPPQHVADNVAAIFAQVRAVSPRTELFLQSILPSAVGQRTLAAEQQANALLQQVAAASGTTYIDLWEPMAAMAEPGALSLDGLHLTAAGYKVWADIVAPYLASGAASAYPAGCDTLQDAGGMGWSHGMRATYFSLLPYDADDILFFGDEMVKAGEWGELLDAPRLLNRGSGWGYEDSYTSINVAEAMVRTTLGTVAPRAVWLYTGTGDVNIGAPMDSVCDRYARLLHTLWQRCPGTPVYALSLMPVQGDNARVRQFNAWLESLCRDLPELTYVDIFSPLQAAPAARCFEDNYLMADGYQVVADVLRPYLQHEMALDYRILKQLQNHRRPGWDNHWVWMSNSLPLCAAPTIGLGLASFNNVHPKTGYDNPYAPYFFESLGALGATGLVTTIVKNSVCRQRPWVRYEGDLYCLQHVSGFSHPSGHTSFSFAAATTLSLIYPRWYVIAPAYLWAASVGFSRLYVGAHFPSDVLAGAVIGTACSILAHYVRTKVSDTSPAFIPQDAVIVPLANVTF